MKTTVLLVLLLVAGVVVQAGAGFGSGEIVVARIEWLPESWSEPEMTVGANGTVAVKPAVPTLKQEQLGIRMRADDVQTRATGMVMVPVGSRAAVLDRKGVKHRIRHRARYVINGATCLAIGEMAGNIYFKDLARKRYFTVPNVAARQMVGPDRSDAEPAAPPSQSEDAARAPARTPATPPASATE